MIYRSPDLVPWDAERWPNFKAREFACKHCGECYDDPRTMDGLQVARYAVGAPFRINSAHRCHVHNHAVGGAPRSQHLKLAVDVSLRGHDRHKLRRALILAGFTGIGLYTSFIHVDLGPKRSWYGKGARASWH